MESLTASIIAVGEGKVTVRMKNGMKMSYRTDKGFKYGERVLVLLDLHHLEIKDIIYPEELNQEEKPVPKFPHREYQVGEEYPVDQEGSFPRPAVAPEEFEEESQEQEWE